MDIEQMAFERLRLGAETSKRMYNAPLLLCYSGGKDSDVLLQLAINSGIDFEVLHNHTTIDAPETVYHIRNTFKKLELQGIKCTIEKPTYKGERVTMWSLIPQVMLPPTRLMRYCCSVLKEKGGGETGLLRQVFAEPKAVHALSVEYLRTSITIKQRKLY